jgi:hypothetical protein
MFRAVFTGGKKQKHQIKYPCPCFTEITEKFVFMQIFFAPDKDPDDAYWYMMMMMMMKIVFLSY